VFEDGDVVVAKITPCFENGKAALAQSLRNGVAFGTTELHVLRAGNRLDRRFLFYLTISHTFRALGESEMYGAGGQKRVPPEFPKDFRVPLPPIDEQQTIARFLDSKAAQIDALIATKLQLIDKLKEKRQALIARAVTCGLPPEAAEAVGLEPNPAMKHSGVMWLGLIPAHWKTTELKYAASKIIDCPHDTPEYDPTGAYYVVRTADISAGTLDMSRAYRVDVSEYLRRIRRGAVLPADILYGREGERWGFAATVPADITLCLGQRMMQFRAGNRFVPRFLMWHLNARTVYEQGALDTTGSTAPHVNVETIRNYQLVEPPLPEQSEIAKFIDVQTAKLDSLVERVVFVIARLREYRQALITCAVLGQIDVRE
jgi:type I restriction enzyme S subunit